MSEHTDDETDDSTEQQNKGGAPKGNKNAQGNSGGPGAPEGNMHAFKHGIHSDPFHLYQFLDEEKRQFVDDLVDSYADLLDYEDDDPRIERVRRAAMHIYQSWAGEAEILDHGLSEDTVVGVNDRGEPIIDKDGHHLHRFTFKRDQEARQILRTLGAFDDPESQKADALNNATNSWEQFIEQGNTEAGADAGAESDG